MSPIQQMLLGVGAVAKKTFVDDLFSTFLYKGTSANQAVNNGINLSGEGGMTWLKSRNQSYDNWLFDTERGSNKAIRSNLDNVEITDTAYMNAFNNNGFTVGSNGSTNYTGIDFASWTFRKAPGFFDVVTYTGNGTSGRTINHSLGSVPGMIMIKQLNAAEDWVVYHRGTGNGNKLYLNTNDDIDGTSSWNYTTPTSTTITFSSSGGVNGNNDTYVAYLFAGGESTAATARSVDFDGSNDYLSIPDSTDYEFGSGDFTVEAWVRHDATSYANEEGIVSKHYGGYSSWRLVTSGSGSSSTLKFIWMDSNGNENTVTGGTVERGQWTHVAVSRSGNTIRMFVNGLSNGDVSFNNTIRDGDVAVEIGTSGRYANEYWDGQISNVRIVKGTGIYTSSFKPSTTAFTSITNTKLLCCQSSTVTTATTITGSITNNGAAASTDSPFDDPAGFVFGENEDQNVIKCGSYVGNGDSNNPPEVHLGFEPSWLLIKNTSTSGNVWQIFDVMRGLNDDGTGASARLEANNTSAEVTNAQGVTINSTGFIPTGQGSYQNSSGDTFIYMALRRPDGYVGKPPELGTDVFAMDLGVGNSSDPAFLSGFPVDFVIYTEPAGGSAKSVGTRLLGSKKLATSSTDTEANDTKAMWDNNGGYGINRNSDFIAWMWKRHAGCDVVTYTGNGTSGLQIPHNLSKTPEMMWVKSRSSTRFWPVYHKDLNGGSSPAGYYLRLNNSQTSITGSNSIWNNQAPTSTHFILGDSVISNGYNEDYIAMLFASVDGISKVGSYTGNGSTGQTITLGFQPRFIIIRKYNDAAHWLVLDTTRGWGSGDDKYLLLNSTGAQGNYEVGAPVSNGFTLVGDNDYNNSSGSYIYYAHA